MYTPCTLLSLCSLKIAHSYSEDIMPSSFSSLAFFLAPHAQLKQCQPLSKHTNALLLFPASSLYWANLL